MDVYSQRDMIIWSTQFNPGGIFYKRIHGREKRQANSGLIVSKYHYIFESPYLSTSCFLNKMYLLQYLIILINIFNYFPNIFLV